ncbi:hypothetical protein COU53_01660 [Candidatus Pacearchaeota archaeon CG10_big_fil_rev_8_21_14_0_10_30_48]|nr:MAG: hypothetical protein COU53_01660 [Candidatus Pacearchaeota archaeon CG10_big_fil_rev_8_21_14_0_10_30_48]
MERKILDASLERNVSFTCSLGLIIHCNLRDYASQYGNYDHYIDTILKEIPEIKKAKEIERKKSEIETGRDWIIRHFYHDISYEDGLKVKIKITDGKDRKPDDYFDVSVFNKGVKQCPDRKFRLDAIGNMDEISGGLKDEK